MKYKHTVISRFIWEKWLLQPTSVEAICAKIEVNLVDNLNSVAFKNERYLVASSLEWWMDVSSLKWMVEHIQCTSSWNDANTKHIVLTRKPNFEKKYTNNFHFQETVNYNFCCCRVGILNFHCSECANRFMDTILVFFLILVGFHLIKLRFQISTHFISTHTIIYFYGHLEYT